MSPEFALARARNADRDCNASGCGQPRHGLNAWCCLHVKRAGRYGHPHARPLRPSTWKNERKEVAALFDRNPNHPGLLQVVNYLHRLMVDGVDRPKATKGSRELGRLHQAGVPAIKVATEVCAFWLWQSANLNAFPDQRSLDFAISRAVFGLVPRDRIPTGRGRVGGTWGLSAKGPQSTSIKPLTSALAYVGKSLRLSLSAFLANVAYAVEQQREVEKDPQVLYRMPFMVPIRGHGKGGLPFPT